MRYSTAVKKDAAAGVEMAEAIRVANKCYLKEEREIRDFRDARIRAAEKKYRETKQHLKEICTDF